VRNAVAQIPLRGVHQRMSGDRRLNTGAEDLRTAVGIDRRAGVESHSQCLVAQRPEDPQSFQVSSDPSSRTAVIVMSTVVCVYEISST
jgi:hypothetical protein